MILQGNNSGNMEWIFTTPEEDQKWFIGILDSINDGILVADEFSVVR